LSCPHFAFFADWAFADVDPGEPEQRFLPSLFVFVVLFGCADKKPTTGGKLLLAAAVPKQTVMPDLHEPVGQNVKQEPPDELIGFKGHDFGFVAVRIVAPPDGDFVVFEFHKPMVADRDPVGISAQIIKNVLGPFKGLLAVDDPVLLIQVGDQGIEGPRRRKLAYGAGVDKFVLGTELFQIRDKLPPKKLRHDLDVDEEVLLARLPFPSITGKSSAGNDNVKMGVVHQVLAPGVQDADKPDYCSKAFRIRSKFRQGFRNGFEQQSVEDFLIPEDKGIENVGNSEDDVEVRYGKEVFFPGFDPLLFLEELALGAVPVAAGVVRNHLVAAVIALIHVATLVGSAAGFNRSHGA
jgi:hypothetical protein